MPSTIRRGSTGPDVAQWQGIIGVTTDGAFGPNTEAATKTWQAQHKLVADGVVGPATWSAALGTKVKITQKTSAAPTDNEAYRISVNANKTLNLGMTDREIQYVDSDARGEGFYGHGWDGQAMSYQHLEQAQTFGLTGNEGVGSNNWGAIQGAGDAGSFPHLDHHADGTPYVGQYKRYSTPELGFADMAKVILGGGTRGKAGATAIRAAINRGDMKQAVVEQHANGYFELSPDKYFDAMNRNYQVLLVNNDWKDLFSPSLVKTVLRYLGFAVAIVIGGGAAYTLSRK